LVATSLTSSATVSALSAQPSAAQESTAYRRTSATLRGELGTTSPAPSAAALSHGGRRSGTWRVYPLLCGVAAERRPNSGRDPKSEDVAAGGSSSTDGPGGSCSVGLAIWPRQSSNGGCSTPDVAVLPVTGCCA
jgi:hypothetical protein